VFYKNPLFFQISLTHETRHDTRQTGEMRVHAKETQLMALFGFLLFVINFESVQSRKSPLVSITAEDLPRSSFSKMKRSDGSALIANVDASSDEMIERASPMNFNVSQESINNSSLDQTKVQSVQTTSPEENKINSSVHDIHKGPSANTSNAAKKISPNSGVNKGIDAHVIIGCVIMIVIVILGLGIGLGLNIYGKRQDTSRDAIEFGMEDDSSELMDIRQNPNAY